MLDHLGWPGVLNLELAHLDQGELTDNQVQRSGRLRLGARLAHLHATRISPRPGVDLDHEIADSRTELQERFEVPVDFFCYPAGAYDDTVCRR